MIRHLLKLVWRRKRSHGLLIVEFFASFLVLFAVASAAAYFGGNWARPLGFDWHDVWVVDVAADAAPEGEDANGRRVELFRTLLREVRGTDGVVAAAGASSTPYDGSTWTSSNSIGDGSRVVQWHQSAVSDGFFEAMRVPLVAGREFAPEDSALDWVPLVIDRELAHAWFDDDDPIGRNPPWNDDGGESRRYRVVGLVDEYRKNGELAGATNFAFRLLDAESPESGSLERIVLRVSGAPPPGFEQSLLETLRRLAPTWSFDIHALEDVRAGDLRLSIAPLLACAVLAGFLLLMVALGLVGVMWQNVTQRTREIGLRRATGASAAAIRRQVLVEMLLMAGFGVALGVVVVAQLPVLGWFPALDGRVIGSGLVAAALSIATLTLLCGVVPSRLATAVHPAEALHYE